MEDKSFDNPILFLDYLKAQPLKNLNATQLKKLVEASIAALDQCLKNQDALAQKIFDVINILNQHHDSWGHKLSDLYAAVDAGLISPDDMNKVLQEEVHKIL
jgi:hypothetical protein